MSNVDDDDVTAPMIAFEEIKWLKPLTPMEEVIQTIYRIQKKHLNPTQKKKETVNKFWQMISDDLHIYEKQLDDTKPFEKTCYKCCTETCIKKWDKSYWEFKIAGLRQRNYVSEYKFPVKFMSVILVFIAGVFKLVRANQDGKASFYANIIHVLTNTIVIFIFWLDGERIMLLPKFGSIIVSVLILYGILKHAADEGVGI